MSTIATVAILRREDWLAVGAIALAAALYLVLSFDQGQMLSIFQGASAFDQNFIHELVHDARHAACLPCH
jgi:hypothetical protein